MHQQNFPTLEQALDQIDTKIDSLLRYILGAWSQAPCNDNVPREINTEGDDDEPSDTDTDRDTDTDSDEHDVPAFETGDRISGPGLPSLAVRRETDGVVCLERAKPTIF